MIIYDKSRIFLFFSRFFDPIYFFLTLYIFYFIDPEVHTRATTPLSRKTHTPRGRHGGRKKGVGGQNNLTITVGAASRAAERPGLRVPCACCMRRRNVQRLNDSSRAEWAHGCAQARLPLTPTLTAIRP